MFVFFFSLRVVEMMRSGMDPVSAIKEMLNIINRAYPGYAGAMVAVNKDGDYGRYITLQYTLRCGKCACLPI